MSLYPALRCEPIVIPVRCRAACLRCLLGRRDAAYVSPRASGSSLSLPRGSRDYLYHSRARSESWATWYPFILKGATRLRNQPACVCALGGVRVMPAFLVVLYAAASIAVASVYVDFANETRNRT